MREALQIAGSALSTGDVPVGAIVVNKDGVIIGKGFNEREANSDPTAHAEVVAIRNAAARLQNSRLDGCTLIVTLEPCAMCAGAIAHARIARLYYAASDPKGGAVEHGARVFDQPQFLHRPEVYSGIGEQEAAELLRGFFRDRR